MPRVVWFSLLAAAMAVFLAGCASQSPATPSTELVSPVLGDTRLRPADQATMLFAPGGSFMMGSDRSQSAAAVKLCRAYTGDLALGVCQPAAFSDESPAHPVTLDGFWLDDTEVTNGQYRACLEAGICTPPAELGSYTRERYFDDPAFAQYPVIWVTAGQADTYCRWAGARLPTEAEWEYAARGPENLIFPWGNEFDGARLNYCDASCPIGVLDPSVDDGHADTAPVGTFPDGASWIGALDMAGNVREWVADWYGRYQPEEQVNPGGPETGTSRIPRGGSWLDKPDDIRGANRGENESDYVRHKVGFRCAAGDP